MNEMKYITVAIDGVRVPVIFGKALAHKAVYDGVRLGNREHQRKMGKAWEDPKLLSAGFVFMEEMKPYGDSESLGIGCDKKSDERCLKGEFVRE